MDATILGMDPINFTLTVISVLGLLFSIAAFVRHFDSQSGQWLAAAEGMDCVRAYFESIAPMLSARHERRLRLHVKRLENTLAVLMLGTIPRSSGSLQRFKGWTKTWRLFWLAKEIHACTIILRMISKQKERVIQARVEHEAVAVDVSELEATVEASIERLIMSLSIRESTAIPRYLRTDLEANHPSPTPENTTFVYERRHSFESNTPTLYSGSRESLQISDDFPEHPNILPLLKLPIKPPKLHFPADRKPTCNMQ